MKKLAILLNIIAPARVPLYSYLAEHFDTLILHGGTERNRNWSVNLSPTLKTRKVLTVQLKLRKMTGVSGVTDPYYLHLNFGTVLALKRFAPDIIVTNEMGFRSAVALIYGKFARIPVWVWWGGTVHSELHVAREKKLLRRFFVREVRHWISYGETSTEYLESIGVARARILEAQNCIPQETFQVLPSNSVNRFEGKCRPAILTVGQLIERKGFDRLIEACGRLSQAGRAVSLTIVGEGSEQDRLKALAKKMGLEDFTILPNQSQPNLNELYRSADAFVFPTLEDVWGLVVNETLWAGTPVLCSKYAGCAEELLPPENIFDPLSPSSFDAALTQVANGTIRRADPSKLKTWQEVGELMVRALKASSAGGGAR